jgi:hypothetical protein
VGIGRDFSVSLEGASLSGLLCLVAAISFAAVGMEVLSPDGRLSLPPDVSLADCRCRVGDLLVVLETPCFGFLLESLVLCL